MAFQPQNNKDIMFVTRIFTHLHSLLAEALSLRCLLAGAVLMSLALLGSNVQADVAADKAALEALANAQYQDGDYRRADLTYGRLLQMNLGEPVLAFPYAICKWHLRQEYDAQATMIQALREVKLSPGNVSQLQNALTEYYNPASIAEAFKPEFLDEAELQALEHLNAYIQEVVAETSRLEEAGDEAEMARFLRRLFGSHETSRAFYALWRSFALAYEGKLGSAEMMLRLADSSSGDLRLKADSLTATALLTELKKERGSADMLKPVTDFLSDTSASIGVLTPESQVRVSTLLGEARELLDQRSFSEAAARLDTVRPLLTRNEDKIQYLYFHAEALWSLAEYTRADQAYVATSVMLRDRYFISTAIYHMAEYAAMLHRREDAAQYALRSAAIMRDDSWVLRRTGNFFLNIDMTERGLTYLERAFETSDTLQNDADCYAALADAYKRIGEPERFLEYARLYVETIDKIIAQNGEYSDEQKGLAAYYQGDILTAEDKFKEAYTSYEAASTFLTEPYRLAEVYSVMAEYQATAGNIEKAESLAVKSADLLPGDAWKLRQVGGLLVRLGNKPKADHYLERALELSSSVRERAYSFIALAEASLAWGDISQFKQYADQYIALVKLHRDQLSDAEEGFSAFFQGEMYFHQGARDLAYSEYERAAGLLDDRFKRAEAWMRLAELEARAGNLERATELADKSAGELPDQGWKMQLVGDFFLQHKLYDKAEWYYRRYAQVSAPDDPVAYYSIMANVYKQLNRPNMYIETAGDYITAVTADGRVPTDEEAGLSAYYKGEIHALRSETDQAYSLYEEASAKIHDNALLAEIYQKMANIEAKRGNQENAALLAAKAGELSPEAQNTVRQEAASSSRSDSRPSGYSANQAPPNVDNKGAHYYRLAEQHAAEQRYAEALTEYERAAQLFTDKRQIAGAYLAMARLRAAMREDAAAVDLMKKAVALTPKNGQLYLDVGDLFKQLGQADEALVYYDDGLKVAEESPVKALILSAVAMTYRDRKEMDKYYPYAQEFVRLASSGKLALSKEMKGLLLFHQGGILFHEQDYDGALRMAGQAVPLFANPYMQFDALLLMAESQARMDNPAEAGKYAAQAADLLKNDPWPQRKIGEFFANLGQVDTALIYYRRFLELGKDDHDRAAAYATLAGTYRGMGNQEKYLEYARLYIKTVSSLGDGARDDEKGEWGYYYGVVMTAEKNPEEAYRGYSMAAEYLTEKYRLSEVYARMARHNADVGNRDLAQEQALRAAELMPADYWRVKDAVDVLVDAQKYDSAIQVLGNVPEADSDFHLLLSTVYQRAGRRSDTIESSREYIDALIAEMGMTPGAPTKEEQVNLWNARRRHGNLTRLLPDMSMELVYGGTEYANNDFTRNMKAEFNKYFYHNNYLRGSVYAILDGYPDGSRSGTYTDVMGDTQTWENSYKWSDNHNLAIGLRINPFDGVWESLNFKGEQVFGLGANEEHDFRFILNYDRSSDDTPHLDDQYWPYWKIWSDVARWSTRNEDLQSFGSFKQGMSLAAPWDRNTVVNVYAMETYSYLGRHIEASSQWGAEAGVGIDFKKYFGETKYRTAMESVEISLYYLWAVTDSREDGLGFALTFKF